MALQQSGLLTSWFSQFRRTKAKRVQRGSLAFRKAARRSITAVEPLEDRRMMVSHVFVDFGHAFPVNTQPTSPYFGLQVLENSNGQTLRDNLQWNGTGATFGSNFGLMAAPASQDIDLVSFGDVITAYDPIDVDGDGVSGTPYDVIAAENSILASIKRALEPFDIGVSEATSGTLAAAMGRQQSNNVVGGTAVVPQFGEDDIYIFITGAYTDPNNVLVPLLTPISASFSVDVPSPASTPDRKDSGAIIDVNYWVQRVLGPAGTSGYINVAMANAALYAVGWGYGLPEVENGTRGSFTQYVNSDTKLINQANAMVEAGFSEGAGDFYDPTGISTPINELYSGFFNRNDMMQDGTDFQPLMRKGVLGNPPVLSLPAFPLPPEIDLITTTINTDPNKTVNLYDILVNDSDIGRNPDAEYVTGTGAFDRIYITKIGGNRASVTVDSYREASHSHLIASESYTINLSKIVTPGRLDSGQPFRLIVEGCNSDDQIFLDPSIGVRVIVHGGPDVEKLKLTGNGKENVTYTPDAPNVDPSMEYYIPEGLLREASGVMQISGGFGLTTVVVDNFNPQNTSAIRLENFNQVTYKSPGYLDMSLNVTIPRQNEWNIAGQVANDVVVPPGPSVIYPPIFAALTGDLQFSKINQLRIDTSLGRTNDTISFDTNATLSSGLKHVYVKLGSGNDHLNFNDTGKLENLNYFLSPTQLDYGAGVSSKFTGFSYSGADNLSLSGTEGFNNFVVVPSKKTNFLINGDDPPNGSPSGDSLAIRRAGTTGATLTPNGAGNGTWSFTSGHKDVVFTSMEEAVLPPSVVALTGASDTGKGRPLVKVFDAATNELLYSFYAYPTSFRGGVRVAVADMNADLVPDVVVAPGAGRGDVKVFDGATLQSYVNGDGYVSKSNTAASLLDTFKPEGSSYKNGLYVAVGDVDADGDIDIATSRARGETRVRVFENDGSGLSFDRIASWRPYSKNVVSGAQVAMGDIDKDGLAEVITVPGAGVAATVKIFAGYDGTFISQFNAFPSSFRNGVSLAAGDANGDGRAEIFVGAGAGGNSAVRTFSRTGTLLNEFKAFTSGNTNAPLRIAAVDPDAADSVLLFVGQGNDGKSHTIRLFDPLTSAKVDQFVEHDPAFDGGVFLG